MDHLAASSRSAFSVAAHVFHDSCSETWDEEDDVVMDGDVRQAEVRRIVQLKKERRQSECFVFKQHTLRQQ